MKTIKVVHNPSKPVRLVHVPDQLRFYRMLKVTGAEMTHTDDCYIYHGNLTMEELLGKISQFVLRCQLWPRNTMPKITPVPLVRGWKLQ